MSSPKSIYITSQISVNVLSEIDLLREFEITKLRYDTWKKRSFSEFVLFLKEWGEVNYSFDVEDVAYYLSEEDAFFAIELNIGDLCEDGNYNYASVIRIQTDYLYARHQASRDDVQIFYYDAANDEYVRIYENSNEYKENISFYTLMKDKVRHVKMVKEEYPQGGTENNGRKKIDHQRASEKNEDDER